MGHRPGGLLPELGQPYRQAFKALREAVDLLLLGNDDLVEVGYDRLLVTELGFEFY